MKVKEYYNKEAENYVNKFTKGGILGRLRRKEIDDVLLLLQPREGEEILDAGCGAGVYALKLREAGAVPYGVDISPKMIEKLKSYGIDGCVGDIADIDLGRKFKKIICVGVLEFCEDPRTVIRNLVKHLEDDGRLIILYPRMGIGGGLLYKLYHMLFSGLFIKLYNRRCIESMSSLEIDAWKENFISDVVRLRK